MAAPVRPPVWPPATTAVQTANVRPGRNDARLTAQKAFFEAALGGKSAVAAAAEPERRAAPQVSAMHAARSAAATEAGAADRLPPPGSIVNILV
jgi:predicted component of type VI protein secretion system